VPPAAIGIQIERVGFHRDFRAWIEDEPVADQGKQASESNGWQMGRRAASAGPALVALLGVEDLLVVDTPDALLIARRGKSQQVKEVVSLLKDLESGLLE
jgi:hypothetical protein